MAIKNYKEDRIKALTKMCEEKDEIIAERDQTLADIAAAKDAMLDKNTMTNIGAKYFENKSGVGGSRGSGSINSPRS